MKISCINHSTNNIKPNFKCSATEIFAFRYIKTQKEIVDIFAKDTKSNGIAGTLPPYWLAKLEGKTAEEKEEAISKIFILFRSALKHLKPYNANRGQFKKSGIDAENKRIKEVSEYLTKGLRHFGILDEHNTVILKKLKVSGSFTDRAYQLHEKGSQPSIEPIFIKKFKKRHLSDQYDNMHGKYSELAHGLFLNANVKENFIQRFYWGDTQAGFLFTEYVLPPKHVSPIVKIKNTYESKLHFIKDFYAQTGIKLQDLEKYSIDFGKENPNGTFTPKSKEDIICSLIQAVLDKVGLFHSDLHSENAIIGSTRTGQSILKLIDVGGLLPRF